MWGLIEEGGECFTDAVEGILGRVFGAEDFEEVCEVIAGEAVGFFGLAEAFDGAVEGEGSGIFFRRGGDGVELGGEDVAFAAWGCGEDGLTDCFGFCPTDGTIFEEAPDAGIHTRGVTEDIVDPGLTFIEEASDTVFVPVSVGHKDDGIEVVGDFGIEAVGVELQVQGLDFVEVAVDDADIDTVEIAGVSGTDLEDGVVAMEAADEVEIAGVTFPNDEGFEESVMKDIVGVVIDLGLIEGAVVQDGGVEVEEVESDIIETFCSEHRGPFFLWGCGVRVRYGRRRRRRWRYRYV